MPCSIAQTDDYHWNLNLHGGVRAASCRRIFCPWSGPVYGEQSGT
jgi:hypothetical protein